MSRGSVEDGQEQTPLCGDVEALHFAGESVTEKEFDFGNRKGNASEFLGGTSCISSQVIWRDPVSLFSRMTSRGQRAGLGRSKLRPP